ncbi:MAG: helix-turn-helix transcriptional regulator [Candidatus Woesearchaeota archaeon]
MSKKKSIARKNKKGSIGILILKALTSGDKYGYEIRKEIEEKSGGEYILKEASVYSALRRMKQSELITDYWEDSDKGGKRHYYNITQKGLDKLEGSDFEWPEFVDQMFDDKKGDSVDEEKQRKETSDKDKTNNIEEPKEKDESSAISDEGEFEKIRSNVVRPNPSDDESDLEPENNFEPKPNQNQDNEIYNSPSDDIKSTQDETEDKSNDEEVIKIMDDLIEEDPKEEDNTKEINQNEHKNNKTMLEQRQDQDSTLEPKKQKPDTYKTSTNESKANLHNETNNKKSESYNTEETHETKYTQNSEKESTIQKEISKPANDYTNYTRSNFKKERKTTTKSPSLKNNDYAKRVIDNVLDPKFRVRKYKKEKKKHLLQTSYVSINKVNFATSIVITLLMLIELIAGYILMVNTGFIESNEIIVFSILGFLTLIFFLFHLTVFLLNPKKKESTSLNLLGSLGNNFIILIIILIFIYTINSFVASFLEMNQYNAFLEVERWFMPAVLSVNILFYPIIKYFLLKLKKYHV